MICDIKRNQMTQKGRARKFIRCSIQDQVYAQHSVRNSSPHEAALGSSNWVRPTLKRGSCRGRAKFDINTLRFHTTLEFKMPNKRKAGDPERLHKKINLVTNNMSGCNEFCTELKPACARIGGLSDGARPNHTGKIDISKFSLSNPGILKCHIKRKLMTWKGCARILNWWLSVRVYASSAVQNSSLHAVELGIIQWSEAQSHRGKLPRPGKVWDKVSWLLSIPGN